MTKTPAFSPIVERTDDGPSLASPHLERAGGDPRAPTVCNTPEQLLRHTKETNVQETRNDDQAPRTRPRDRTG